MLHSPVASIWKQPFKVKHSNLRHGFPVRINVSSFLLTCHQIYILNIWFDCSGLASKIYRFCISIIDNMAESQDLWSWKMFPKWLLKNSSTEKLSAPLAAITWSNGFLFDFIAVSHHCGGGISTDSSLQCCLSLLKFGSICLCTALLRLH